MKRKTVLGGKRGWASAFTLIELLVVIAIIALLIAILLPSLEAARRQAKLNACLSHIKNIGTSSRVYEADDASGWGIPAHAVLGRKEAIDGDFSWDGLAKKGRYTGAYEWGGKSGIGWDDFQGSPDPVNSAYGTKAGFGPATRPMNEILYKGGFTNYAPDGPEGSINRIGCQEDNTLSLDLFRCPGDDGPPRGAHCADWIKFSERPSYDHFGTSYTANIFMIGQGGGGGGPIYGNSPYLRPTTRIPTPARTLYYEENIGRWAWSAKSELPECLETVGGPGVDPGPTKAIRGWHGRDWTFNRAFVDAHAETQRIYIEGTEDKDGFAQHYRNEYINGLPQYPGTTDPDPNDRLNERYQCIIVRGDGWQKDTFPAELIPTGLEHNEPGRPSYEKCVTPN